MLDALLGFASLLAADGSNKNAYRVALTVLRQMEISQETRDRAENLRTDHCDKLTPAAIENAQTSAANTTFKAAIREILEKEAARR